MPPYIPKIVPIVAPIVTPIYKLVKPVPRPLLFGLTIAVIAAAFAGISGVTVLQQASASPCGISPAQTAFCDTFDAPSPNGVGTRSGDLDGVVWGVSRATQDSNAGQGSYYNWNTTHRSACGTQNVGPPKDVVICNGQLAESVTDNGAVTVLAMYPRQPFDFLGRTGVVAFDVNSDSQGPHAAWPAFSITDQPVPAPYHDAAGLSNYARNSFGFSVGGNGGNCPSSQTFVDTMWTTTNYQLQERSFNSVGCINRPTSVTQLNHFEVRISPTSVQIWASDPGGSNLHQVANSSFTMPLTRGLIWIEDIHYNGDKFDTQGTHTFVWDNVGFDGPILSRDLGFDVLDATHNGTSGGNLGYLIPQGGTLTINVGGVHDVQNYLNALFEFNWWVMGQDNIIYSVNGHPNHTMAWPYGGGGPTFVSQTLAVPVPISELVNGTNTFKLSTNGGQFGGIAIANIDLILIPDRSGAPVPTATPIKTATPTIVAATAVPPTQVPPTVVPPTAVPAITSTPASSTCSFLATRNGVDTRYSRPLSFCTDQ